MHRQHAAPRRRTHIHHHQQRPWHRQPRRNTKRQPKAKGMQQHEPQRTIVRAERLRLVRSTRKAFRSTLRRETTLKQPVRKKPPHYVHGRHRRRAHGQRAQPGLPCEQDRLRGRRRHRTRMDQSRRHARNIHAAPLRPMRRRRRAAPPRRSHIRLRAIRRVDRILPHRPRRGRVVTHKRITRTIGRSPARTRTNSPRVRAGHHSTYSVPGQARTRENGEGKEQASPGSSTPLTCYPGNPSYSPTSTRAHRRQPPPSHATRPSTPGASTTCPRASRTRRHTFERECALSPFARPKHARAILQTTRNIQERENAMIDHTNCTNPYTTVTPDIEIRAIRAILATGRSNKRFNDDAACN